MTGVCCDVPVDFSSEFVWAAQVAVMRAALEGNERPPVDAVVSSELYGDELAARLGAEHVSVDLGRMNLRVSASQIRADLARCWDDPRHDVHLLTSHEGVPWQDDGPREGDLAVRAAMTAWFEQALTAAGHSWVLLTGSIAERLALAVRVTPDALARRAAFGPAITDTAPAGDWAAR
ncbi:MAG TPA: AAA family ATPase [Streptosporangiaceae bacterium]|nr:AAA family ATPase [Streptosporangiaceae bacterium]